MYKYEVKLIQAQGTVNYLYGSKTKVLKDLDILFENLPIDEEVDLRFIKRYADSFAGDMGGDVIFGQGVDLRTMRK